MMRNVCAEYYEEVYGIKMLYREDEGFITYKFSENEQGRYCFIRDAYVIPELRQTGLCSSMADEISVLALSAGCTFLTCWVDLDNPVISRNTQIYLAYGFKIAGTADNKLFFRKDL